MYILCIPIICISIHVCVCICMCVYIYIYCIIHIYIYIYIYEFTMEVNAKSSWRRRDLPDPDIFSGTTDSIHHNLLEATFETATVPD